jgi:hypothetical protein
MMQAWFLKTLRVVTIPHLHLANNLRNWASVMPGRLSESKRSSSSVCVVDFLTAGVGAGTAGTSPSPMSFIVP